MSSGDLSKIAFLHIPKTAGVSVVDAFVNTFGKERCSVFSEKIRDETFEKVNFVSGHVYLDDITKNAFIFTFLRNPLKQIASHLMWVDHYNMPEFEGEISGFPDGIKEGIRKISKADFSDGESIDRYLQWVSHSPVLRFSNLQSEMLACARGNVPRVNSKELAHLAIGNLNRLQFIGTAETISSDMIDLFKILRLKPSSRLSHLNKSPSSRAVNLSSPGVRRVLEKYVEADMILYSHLLKKRKSMASSLAHSTFSSFKRLILRK